LKPATFPQAWRRFFAGQRLRQQAPSINGEEGFDAGQEEVEHYFYSVPHELLHAQVDVRITSRTIEVFHRSKRVATHARRYGGNRHDTLPEHMPSSHRRYAEWTPQRFEHWAATIGPNTQGLVIAILANRPHPEQGFRTCFGIMKLFRGIDQTRAESVAARALAIEALNCRSVESILRRNLDRTPAAAGTTTAINHPNVRGSRYFN